MVGVFIALLVWGRQLTFGFMGIDLILAAGNESSRPTVILPDMPAGLRHR